MMRMLVTGRNGQLALSLAERGKAQGVEVILLGRPDIDLETPDGLSPAIAAASPDVIVSAAAYTAVDRAETERKRAFAVNSAAPGAIGDMADKLGVPVIHLSTDYVFSGDKTAPYVETDEPNPQSVYGASKLAGERALAAATSNYAILRVAWLYSPLGANFVKTMLRLAGERETIPVVADQRGNPTSALDAADAILAIAPQLVAGDAAHQRGVFHLTGTGEATWAELATATFAHSAKYGGPSAKVVPIKASAYKTLAKRPANSRLDSGKLETAFGVKLPPWQASLDDVVARLVNSDMQH